MLRRLCIFILALICCQSILFASEGYNIEAVASNKGTILSSKDDGYLKITQVGQNSQSVKISTSTFDSKITLSGKAKKGTNITIKVFQDDKCLHKYTTVVGITGTFTQTLDLALGENKVYIYYTNETDKVDNKVMIIIRRESVLNKEKLKTWVDTTSLK